MHFTAPAYSTLYIKASLRKSPYSNKVVALRISANFYKDFTSRDAKFMREFNPAKITAAQLHAVFAQMQKEANAANIIVNVGPAVYKALKEE